MASKLQFAEEEMVVQEGLGYPKAYAKLCRNANPYSRGPPFAFVPYALQLQESMGEKDLDQMFPTINPEANPSVDPESYVDLLWTQLGHLGNAGFDPALFRVDPYGNVLYFHADPASPLYWDIDHWFPCSRGGRTVLGNLRLLQWQVRKKKLNKLEFLIPWWDLQLGVSVNQFLSIFASKYSDFRNRGFSFLFLEGENEELNELQVVESHTFPQHFIEMKRHVGLAPAAIVSSQRYSGASLLKSLNLKNRALRPHSPSIAEDGGECLNKVIQGFRPSTSKENDDPNMGSNGDNPYLSIAMARDSLREREETKKIQAEIRGLENELNGLKQKNERERLALQDLEAMLIKKKRRVEKCRRLAESQASYRNLLEKMIRDAMHQNVVYKEQVRLNQAAASALMARLEAQKAICDSSEKELHRRYKQRDELEKQTRPYCDEQARKRSRMDDTLFEDRQDDTTIHLLQARRRMKKPSKKDPSIFLEEEQKASESLISPVDEEPANTTDVERMTKPSKKELRIFLEEEQKASEAGISLGEEIEEEQPASMTDAERAIEYRRSATIAGDEILTEKLAIEEDGGCKTNEKKKQLVPPSPLTQEDEEYKNQVGKGNVEKWLKMMLFGSTDEGSSQDLSYQNTLGMENSHKEELIHKLNSTNPQKEINFLRLKPSEDKSINDFRYDKQRTGESSGGGGRNRKEETFFNTTTMSQKSSNRGELGIRSACRDTESSKSIEVERGERRGGGLVGLGSARATSKHFPSSPSVILGMRRGMDCIGKKPVVVGDNDDDGNDNVKDNHMAMNNNKHIQSCSQAMKKKQ